MHRLQQSFGEFEKNPQPAKALNNCLHVFNFTLISVFKAILTAFNNIVLK